MNFRYPMDETTQAMPQTTPSQTTPPDATLLSRVNARRAELRQMLSAKDADEAIALCQKVLREAAEDYLEHVPSHRVHLTSLLLEQVTLGLEHTLAASEVVLWQPYQPQNERSWLRVDVPILRRFARLKGLNAGRFMAQVGLFALLAIFLFLELGRDPLLIVALALLGALGYVLFAPLGSAKSATQNAADNLKPDQLEHHIRLDVDRLFGSLSRACDAFDRAVTELDHAVQSSQQRPAVPISDAQDVLELLQGLAEAAQRDHAELALARSNDVRSILQARGMTLVDYPANGSGQDAWFEFEPSLDPKSREYRTLRPALVRDDTLVLRGRAVEPQVKS